MAFIYSRFKVSPLVHLDNITEDKNYMKIHRQSGRRKTSSRSGVDQDGSGSHQSSRQTFVDGLVIFQCALNLALDILNTDFASTIVLTATLWVLLTTRSVSSEFDCLAFGRLCYHGVTISGTFLFAR